MSTYALFPLIAFIAYIPLLIATISSRPWQTRHKLFILFLIPAMAWSLTDVLLRSSFFPQFNFFLFQCIIITFAVMAAQLHCFASSFYAPGQGRWLPFAYASLAVIIASVALGYVPEGVTANGDKIYFHYGSEVIILFIPLIILIFRSVYIFWKRLRILDNVILYNQIVSLLLGLSAITIFTLAALLPWGREWPISHFGNLINAFILSYAVIRHQLVDIKLVLRQGLGWTTLGIIGAGSYWLLLVAAHSAFRFELDLSATFIATAAAMAVAIFIYRLRGFLFAVMSRAFQGQTYDSRQNLSDFASEIHNVFSFKEQGGELLALVIKAVDCKEACLLFPEEHCEYFTAQIVEPKTKANPLANLKLGGDSPIVQYLKKERKPLTRENLAILPELSSLRQEGEDIESNGTDLFMPLISRDKLVAIMALGGKQSGRYSLEDLSMLEDVTARVAVSMEKEYLWEQLREREKELSVINRSNTIITSNLDIQATYDSFINELKKVVDVSWAAIALTGENHLRFLALSSEIGSAWQAGERMPIKGTGTEWVVSHKKVLVEPDIAQESRFTTGEYHLKQGVRSIAYLPLIAKGEAIGSLIVASCRPDAYNQRHIALLEQLASQIAMPVENARLYAEVEEKARIDELTGLLNRRSLDEMITHEVGRHSRYGGVFSLIILDLDSFKVFNDYYGHPAGDKLLRQIGVIIKDTIRSADQAFRYGGDEFAVLLPQTAIDAANQMAERVRKNIAAKVKTGETPITASLGLASWPADGIGPNEIIAAADVVLYRAKRSGGNQSHCASGTLLHMGDTEVSIWSDDEYGAISAIYALATTVDSKDHYTRKHSKTATKYALILAEALCLDQLEISRLENCALLHDIGKIGISNEILTKQGKLTEEEWEIVKTHPTLGATIASRAHQLAPYVAGIMHHHERYNGSGYPEGLKGEDIPLEARILAIADAFAAMTSERPYAPALSYEKALEEIKRGAGEQFDPFLVEMFLAATRKLVPRHKEERKEVKSLKAKTL